MKKIMHAISLVMAIMFSTCAMAAGNDKIAENMAVLNARTEQDTAKYISLAYETIRMAEAEGQKENVAKCYRYLIYYCFTYINTSRAYVELQKLHDFVKQTGVGSEDLYISWQNAIQSFFNESNPLRAMQEFHEMEKMALDNDDHFGLAHAYTSLGYISEYAYETGIENFEKALYHTRLSGNLDSEYYIYYLMASLAYSNQKYDDVLKYLDFMEKVEYLPKKLTFDVAYYGYSMRLWTYVDTGRKEDADKTYETVKQLWDDNMLPPFLRGQYATALCMYLCVYGNPTAAEQYMDFITQPDEKLQMQTLYYKSKGDYKRAYELQDKFDSLKLATMVESQRAKVDNARDFYTQKATAAKNLAIEMAKTKFRNVLLGIVLLFVVIIAIGINVTVRRHYKELRAERDKTDEQRRLAEAERAKAVHLNEMKSTFINNLTHEVRTPLNSLIGFNDMLNNSGMEFSEEERSQMLSQINAMAGQLTSLLDNVIFMSRIDGNDIKPVLTEVQVGEVVTVALSMVEGKVAKGVICIADAAMASDLMVKADRELLQRAVTAVLDNAAKFTKEGHIEVVVSRCGSGKVQIKISNTGDVIPASAAEQIFERFEKLGRFEPGFGLGISTARDILALMHGTIVLDTSFTSGACFVITV